MTEVDPVLLDDLKCLLRNALKLGQDAEIPDDMALIGGPIDIDSIDILLVISRVEKQFGMKVPNEAMGRSAFGSVQTLARYVQDNRAALKATPLVPGIGAVDYLARLPHGPEFRVVSEGREVDPGRAAFGIWNIRGDEPFLKGHFPGRPIVPGVLLTEALSQIAGIAGAGAGVARGVIAQFAMKFVSRVVPPAAVELRAQVSGGSDGLKICDVVASVSGLVAARGTVGIHFGA